MRIAGMIALLLLSLFFFPRPLFSEPTWPTTATESEKLNTDLKENQVFDDTVAAFNLFTSLTGEVRYRRDSVYPVALKAATREEAVAWLRQGFDDELAVTLANYYLAWDEQFHQLVVIPEESIPVLTKENRPGTVVTFRNHRQARLECLLYDCYAPEDCYRYIIETENSGERWKITDLTLEQVEPGRNF